MLWVFDELVEGEPHAGAGAILDLGGSVHANALGGVDGGHSLAIRVGLEGGRKGGWGGTQDLNGGG